MCSGVFPTPVGMVREREIERNQGQGFPHARGDGPNTLDRLDHAILFSPRPWGWSDHGASRMSTWRVFPTPVGMVRWQRRSGMIRSSFPHARGDGPWIAILMLVPAWFSPRPWGWSAVTPTLHALKHVFPTPVGMVRWNDAIQSIGLGFPHARGDGPRSSLWTAPESLFSPRPWGWSGTKLCDCGHTQVFPTPVGMVRAREQAHLPH